MSVSQFDIRRGSYYDSVVLMQLQRGLLELPGVIDSGVVMATQANRELLAANNLLPESIDANPDDLLIVVQAEDEVSAQGALQQVDSLLARRKFSDSMDFRPRSLGVATKQLPEAGWVLVSVPGRYAALVAREALELGKHVFLYSDNVSLEDEISLKKSAREKGLLVMGPDCGTAIINGIGMGFANHVRRGSIGVIGASGTGIQSVTSEIHVLGKGISHAIGTGGRDLKTAVGAITAHQALDLLARDASTDVIVLISKPPSPDVATKLLIAAQAARKPVVVNFIGYPATTPGIDNLSFATSLTHAASLAVQLVDNYFPEDEISEDPPREGDCYLRGLFSGGTLAYQATLGLQTLFSPLFSNTPIDESQKMIDPFRSTTNSIVDLGDEIFMVGRLHPMIDNDLRIRRFRQEADDPDVGIILMDIVLGEGAHPDPAAEFVPAIEEIKVKRPGLEIVVIVIGTNTDPQNMGSQANRLREAGAVIFPNVDSAIDYVARATRRKPKSDFIHVSLDSLTQPLAAVNIGLESFYESLISQGAKAVQMDWRPPAGGNEKLAGLLAKMKSRKEH